MSNISKNIKQVRLAHEMSQTQLAEKIGVSRQSVSSWERGVSMPDLQMLVALANALGVEIEVLIYGSGNKKGKRNDKPLTGKFIFYSLIVYFVLFIPGGMIALPLLKLIVGGSPANDFVIILYWGLLLLVGYIAICTCLLSEYITNSYSDISSIESEQNKDEDSIA